MKKTLLILSALCVLVGVTNVAFAEEKDEYAAMPINLNEEETKTEVVCKKELYREYFALKLRLSEEQKVKLSEMRKEKLSKVRPLLKEMEDKMLEARAVKLSRISVRMQEEKLAQLDKEIVKIRKKISKVCVQASKDFESMLSREQKNILKQMRKDRAKSPMAIGCF